MRGACVRLAVVAGLMVAAGSLSVNRVAGQEASGALGQREPVRTLSYHGDMTALLRQLAESYSVTIGLEVDPQQPKSTVKVFVRDATLRDMVEAITRAEPRYAWREGEGFFDVYPVSGRSPLLETVIGSLRVRDADRVEATEELLGLPEVQAGVSAGRLVRREAEGWAAEQDAGGRFSLELKGVTARAALHEIVRKSGGRFWEFRRSGSAGEYFSLSTSARR